MTSGLSENVRIVREDVLELNGDHIHSYIDVTTFDLSYRLQMCIVKLNCPAPFRWRWNDFFDWILLKEDPRIYEIRRIGLAISGGLSSNTIRPLSKALAAARVCRAALDEHTCEACTFYDGTDALPPHDDCTSEDGCRCCLVVKEG